MFKTRAIFLLVISAILIPLIFMTSEIYSLATGVALFVLAQAIFIYLFYKEPEARLEHWYVLWTAVLSLVYMLVLVLLGRSLLTEFLGLLLFLIYFIGLLILLFKGKIKLKPRKREKQASEKLAVPENSSFLKKEKKLDDEDFESFRTKDDLKEMAEFFEPELEQKRNVQVVDLEEPKIEKIIYEPLEDEEPKPRKQKQASKSLLPQKSSAFLKLRQREKPAVEFEEAAEEEEDWRGELPKSMIFDYEVEKQPIEMPEIRELKEAPKVDFDKVKDDLERIRTGVKTIREKIREINEKAIKESEENKRIQEAVKKMPKPKKTQIRVFASKTGSKFHYKRNCLGLRRVSSKNLVTYANSEEARKKKLKPCGMCR
jgi:hypothetical protein